MTAPIPLDEERIVSPGIITVSDRHDGLLFLHSSLYQLPASLSGNIVAITKHFVAFLPNMRHEDTIDRYIDWWLEDDSNMEMTTFQINTIFFASRWSSFFVLLTNDDTSHIKNWDF